MPGGGGGAPLSGDDVRAYGEAGLDELMLSVGGRSPDDLLRRLEAFLRDVAPAAEA